MSWVCDGRMRGQVPGRQSAPLMTKSPTATNARPPIRAAVRCPRSLRRRPALAAITAIAILTPTSTAKNPTMKPTAAPGVRSHALTVVGPPTVSQNSHGCGDSRLATTPRRRWEPGGDVEDRLAGRSPFSDPQPDQIQTAGDRHGREHGPGTVEATRSASATMGASVTSGATATSAPAAAPERSAD